MSDTERNVFSLLYLSGPLLSGQPTLTQWSHRSRSFTFCLSFSSHFLEIFLHFPQILTLLVIQWTSYSIDFISLPPRLALTIFVQPPPELLPVLGSLECYMTPTLDAALLCNSRAGSDLGRLFAFFCFCLSLQRGY